MSCTNCGADLPSGAAFCSSCGHPAHPIAAPPASAEPTTSEDRLKRFIPPALLEKLNAASSPGGGLEGERRRVTMLFCDMQGSSAAAENLDPEDWADIMNGAFEHLIAPVYRYEGTLARLMGDAILAFFGAPISHEDDPERAVRAGLEIIEDIAPYRAEVKRTHGIEFDVRVGINTGLVVVGAIGSDLRVEYTAMGDAVNVAARMEQTAAPGSVQISDDTKTRVERLFDLEDLGPVDVKGRAEAVRSWQVRAPLQRPSQLRGIEGMRAPMIGRDAELSTLTERLDAVRSGNGAIVSVMGEAGLGKSRLMSEFRQHAEGLTWHEGRSLSYESSTAYATTKGIIRGLVGLSESAPATWSGIETAVSDRLPAHIAEVAPFLASALGAEVPERHVHRLAYLDAGARQQRIFEAAATLIAAEAQKAPMVIVFEDLHWADTASLEFAAHLASLAESSPILLILIYRPRRSEPSWEIRERIERDHPHLHTTIALSPLAEADGRTLIERLLDIDGLSPEARTTILDRSDGNPYFLEEVIRSMIDSGIVGRRGDRWVTIGDPSSVTIPDTLRALLTTRLDALDDFCKAVVQAASVFGREFRYEEVAALVDSIGDLDGALVELRRRDLIREIARVPRRTYEFKHALVREASYEGLLKKRRIQLHAGAARYLMTHQPDRVEDIADHHIAAQQTSDALPFLVAAGERALKAYLLPEARRRIDSALALLTETAPAPIVRRTMEASGKIHEALFEMDDAAEMYRRLVAEGERRSDRAMQISGANKLAFIKGVFFGEVEDALAELAATETMAEEETYDEGLVEACVANCYIRSAFADFDMVEHYMKKVAGLGESLGLIEPTLFGMSHFANTLVYLTRFDEGLIQAEKTLAKAEEHGHLKYQAEMLTYAIPVCHLRNGDVASALAALERGMEISLQIGDRASEAFAAVMQGKIALNRGEFDEAVASHKRARIAADATGIPYIRAVGACTSGTCFRRIGGPLMDRAKSLHDETLELMEMPTGKVHGAWIWSEIGQCALQSGDQEKAEHLFRLALDEHTATMWLLRPTALAGLVELSLERDDLDAALDAFVELKEYVTSRKMLDHYIDVELLGARIAARQGLYDKALADSERTKKIASSQNLLRILIDVHLLQIGIHRDRGDLEAAAIAAQDARRVATDIEAGIRSEELRTAFASEMATRLG